MKKSFSASWIKFIVGWGITLGIRLIPFRVPNIEPVLASQMPFAKRFGWTGGLLFGAGSILLYDVLTGTMGLWTAVTATAFGILGVGAHFFFKNRESKPLNYLAYGIIGTIVYDAITGLSVGPLFFGQSFTEALVGQIPFTLYHLAGNVAFSLLVSPLLYRWVVANESLESSTVLEKLGFQHS